MARRKAPDNETNDEASVRRIRETIANHATRNEKTAWGRKDVNLTKILTNELHPLEAKIINLLSHKQDILDRIAILRAEMVETCIHPFEQLVMKSDHVECKFCCRKLQTSETSPNIDE